MARIRERINFIQTLNVNKIEVGSTAFKGDLMFLNLRKVLEEIAFSSLASNKGKYTEASADVATHWNTKKILTKLDQNSSIRPDGSYIFRRQGMSRLGRQLQALRLDRQYDWPPDPLNGCAYGLPTTDPASSGGGRTTCTTIAAASVYRSGKLGTDQGLCRSC